MHAGKWNKVIAYMGKRASELTYKYIKLITHREKGTQNEMREREEETD